MQKRYLLSLAVYVLLAAAPLAWAQGGTLFALDSSKAKAKSEHSATASSHLPVFSIPVEPLGFSAPASLALGQRLSLASLDFLDENRLLFTFRVPGLLRREGSEREGNDSVQRQIRALVLALPLGTVEAEALWTLHDRERYLWMLNDGHFLLRDRNNIKEGDASLEVKPTLKFPGSLLWLETDPTGKFLVTDSDEPEAASVDLVVRILRRDSGQVMLISRSAATVHLAINADGYLESLRGVGNEWIDNLRFFNGGSRIVGRVDSTCSPTFDFVSQREFLANACASSGGRKLVAMNTEGQKLWENSPSGTAIWPLVIFAQNGLRLARETLAVKHPASAASFFESDQITGQKIEVYDAADGKVALEAFAAPALDGGGNVAISPSGKRVAVLNGGAIQIFDLPAPPVLP